MASGPSSGLSSFLSYNSVKLIRVYNPTLAIIYYATALGLFAYVIAYTVVINKGYQEYDTLVGSTMLKVKGSTHTGDIYASPDAQNVTVFDEYDLVVPPLQPDALFVATNYEVTVNQTRGICDGNLPDGNTTDIYGNIVTSGEACNCSLYNGDVSLCCMYGQHTENGMKMGYCGTGGVYCAVKTWCPLEDQTVGPMILDVRNWTVFSRVDVRFPNFDVQRSNTGSSLTLGQNLFAINDIITGAGATWEQVNTKGAIFVATFKYNCDLNKGQSHCNPDVSFIRLDPTDPTAVSKGFNYRYTVQTRDLTNNDLHRDLWKVYGVSVVFQVFGTAGRFSVAALTITLGSGLALVGLATVVCDVIMQYFLPNKDNYVHEKYQTVALEEALLRDKGENGEYLVSGTSHDSSD